MKTRPRRSAALRGFSLIEIMVAVAILAIIIVGLLAMFYMVQRSFRAGTAQVDVMENGRSMMAVMTRELAEMAASNQDGVTNFHFHTSPGYATPAVQTLIDGQQRVNELHDVTFLRRMNDEWMGTAYRIQYADSGVGTLYRLVSNGVTSSSGFSFSTYCFELCTAALPSFTGGTRPALVATNGFYPVLEGVVTFRVEVFDADGNLYPDTNSAAQPFTIVGDSTRGRYIIGDENLGTAFTGTALPAYVDVELAVLEPGALTRFKYRAEADGGPPYTKARDYLREQAGRLHVFRQRVPIRAAAADSGEGP